MKLPRSLRLGALMVISMLTMGAWSPGCFNQSTTSNVFVPITIFNGPPPTTNPASCGPTKTLRCVQPDPAFATLQCFVSPPPTSPARLVELVAGGGETDRGAFVNGGSLGVSSGEHTFVVREDVGGVVCETNTVTANVP